MKDTKREHTRSNLDQLPPLFSKPALSKKRKTAPDFFGPVERSRRALIKSKAPVCRTQQEEAYLQAYELYEAYPYAMDAILTALSEAQIAREGRGQRR